MSKSDCNATLLIITIIPIWSDWMKSTKTSDFTFFNNLFILAIWRELFFMNLVVFLLLIRMIICFLDSPLVIIWICSLALGLPLTMFWIWSIFFVLRTEKASLILMTSDVLVPCLEAYIYDFRGCLVILASLIFLKYLEIWLISFCDLVEISGGIFSILTGISLLMDLFLLETNGIFKVNFTKNFCLRMFKFLLAISESHLDW